MIELGALLGAIVFTHAMLVMPVHVNSSDLRSFVGAIFVAPIAGAIWGACVGAVIHYVANGTVWDYARTIYAIAVYPR